MLGLGIGINTKAKPASLSGVTPLLDDYPGAEFAMSLRYLSSSYTGDVILVRRSSDNAEMGFTPSEIEDGTLTSWVGAGSGFIKTWYDQSGNSNHATQITTTLQPRIVNAGVLDTLNGKPVIFAGIGSNTSLLINPFIPTGITNGTYFTVGKFVSTLGTYKAELQGNTTSQFFFVPRSGDSDVNISLQAGTNTFYKNGNLIALTTRGVAWTTFVDQQYLLAAEGIDFATSNWSRVQFEYTSSSAITPIDFWQEKIFYSTDQSANRTAIEANINEYYLIY